MMLLLL